MAPKAKKSISIEDYNERMAKYDEELDQARRYLETVESSYDRQMKNLLDSFNREKRAIRNRLADAQCLYRRVSEKRRRFINYHERDE